MSTEIMLANVGNYQLIERHTTDDMLITMWATKSRSANTVAQYVRQAHAFMAAVGKPIQAITFNDLLQWQETLGGKINTQRLKVNAIRSLFSFAHRVGYINVNPGAMLRPPELEETKHRKLLTEEEIVRLVTAADVSQRDAAIVRVLYSSGCRVSELINLRWQDVIETTDGRAVLIIRGKGGKTRESGISAATFTAILQLRTDETKTEDYIFESNRKQRMNRRTVNHVFEKFSSFLVKRISPHWTRHSHISHALARNANPSDVQEQVGHSSLLITTSYAHKTKSSSDYLII